jgi:hypothetical protein
MRVRALMTALTMLATSLVAVGVAAAPASASVARTIEGRSCPTTGQVSRVLSTQYVCTAEGSKKVWRVNSKTVRANRGCTKLGEIAVVGSSKKVFSCTRSSKSQPFRWKVANKDCRDSYNDLMRTQASYNARLADLKVIEDALPALPANEALSLAPTIATIKLNLAGVKGAIDDLREITPILCSE